MCSFLKILQLHIRLSLYYTLSPLLDSKRQMRENERRFDKAQCRNTLIQILGNEERKRIRHHLVSLTAARLLGFERSLMSCVLLH